MKLVLNYSEEWKSNHWAKAELEITEQDLLPILADNELTPEALDSLEPYHKFLLLNAEAEICLLKQRVYKGIETEQSVSEHLARFKSIKEQVITHLKDTYVPF